MPNHNEGWVDIGVNLTSSQFRDKQQSIVEDAIAADVNTLILTGTNLHESQQAYAFAKEFEQFSTAGIHPHDSKSFDATALEIITELANKPQVVAIGETGLDFNRNYSTPEAQIHSFEEHLKLASTLELPLFLHERDAGDTMYEILKEWRDKIPKAVIHCFTGSKEDLDRYLSLDLHIGITGWICDERRGFHLHELVKKIPEDRLMIETDAPYLLPRTLKPKPKDRHNHPKYLPHIGGYIADLLSKDHNEFRAQTHRTSCDFFNL